MAAPKGNKYAIGNKGGRPTKYKPEYCEQIIEFFSRNPVEIEEIPHYKNGEVAWIDKKRLPALLPTLVDFCEEIGIVNTQTLHDWCEKHKEFKDAFMRAKEKQKNFLIQNGLAGLYNPTAFTFTAANITDMRSQQHIDHTTKSKEITSHKHEVVFKDYSEE